MTDDDRDDDPEVLLEELFVVRQELLAVRTMAAHASATYGRMARLVKLLPEDDRELVADIADRFDLGVQHRQGPARLRRRGSTQGPGVLDLAVTSRSSRS